MPIGTSIADFFYMKSCVKNFLKKFNFFIDVFAFFDIYIVETLDKSQKYYFIGHVKPKTQDKGA